MEKESPKLPAKFVTVALAVIILCWTAFIVKTIADKPIEPDYVQMLIMLVMSVLVAFLVVENNPKEYDIDLDADAAAEGSTKSSTIGASKAEQSDDKPAEQSDDKPAEKSDDKQDDKQED